jgi:cysteine-rich repeat protein
MAFDDVRNVVVLFGGQNARYDVGTTVYGDTWEWNGSVWSQITPLDLEGDGDPGARGGAAMAWDPTHQRVLMFGGFSPDGFYDDLWAWDGQSWQLVETAVGSRSGQPSHRRGAAMTYHTGNNELMLLGGESGGINQADTWLLDFSDNARPAQRIRFDLSTAGITPAAECRRSPSDCSVERIRARWDAGGDGWQAGIAQPGSRLLVWTDLGWIQGGQHDASGASPASLTWETTDVSVIGGTIVEDPHAIYLAVVSRGENGTWPERASVVSDYAELAVDYRVRDICGDARHGQDEACDDGNLLDGDGCDSNCTLTSCGNGIVVAPEECDDGNTVDADGCSASCVVE